MNNADLKSYNSKRKIVQLGFVTNDYKKTIAYLYERLLIGPWVIMEHKSGVTKIKELHGKPVNEPFRFYCASAMLGDMEFEVIQPDYGPNPYSEFLETRGPGIHHIIEKKNLSIITGINNLKNERSVNSAFHPQQSIDFPLHGCYTAS